MIHHEYRCVVMNLVLAEGTGRMTHFQFRVAVHALMHSDERWRLPFEAEWLRRTIDPRGFLKARPEQIAHIRDAFLCAELGYFIHGRYEGQAGLQIAPSFRRDTHNQARAPEPQLELALPSALSVLPPANSALRLEQKQIKDHESPRATPAGTLAALPEPGNRTQWRGKRESTTPRHAPVPRSFARPAEALQEDPLGNRLARFLGPAQMLAECERSGAEWARILREEAGTLEDLLEQGERMGRRELPTPLAKAKFLTARLAERRAGGRRGGAGV